MVPPIRRAKIAGTGIDVRGFMAAFKGLGEKHNTYHLKGALQ
jgi:hypothetical protein